MTGAPVYLRFVALASCLLAVSCAERTSLDEASDREAVVSALSPAPVVEVARFDASYDASTGEFVVHVREADEDLRTRLQSLYTPQRVSGGAEGTFELGNVPGTIGFSTVDCGLPDAVPYNALGTFCATVTIASFFDRGFEDVFATIDEMAPISGYDPYPPPAGNAVDPALLVDGPGNPAAEALGIFEFGSLEARGTSTSTWVFQYASGQFRFSGSIFVAIPERRNDADDNGDGRIDEGPFALGESCAEHSDCYSQYCDLGACIPIEDACPGSPDAPDGDADGDRICNRDDVETCGDGIDNDAEGGSDCADASCAESRFCTIEDECLVENGGCGDPDHIACVDTFDNPPVCTPDFDIIVVPPTEGSTATKTWNLLVVMTNTTGDIPETSEPNFGGLQEYFSPEELVEAYFHHPNSTRAFVRDASYGTVDLEGTVAGWIHEGDLGLSAGAIRTDRSIWAQPVCDVLDCGAFDAVILAAKTETGGLAVGWKLQNTLEVEQGSFTVGFNFLVNSPFFPTALNSYSDSIILPSASWAHELLHTLGISGHGNSLWCGNPDSQASNPRVPVPELDAVLTEPCWIGAYGEGWNIMGERAWGTHPNFVQKIALGWLTEDDVHLISPPGGSWSAASGARYERAIYPLSRHDGLVKGISIDLGDQPLSVTDNGLTIDRVHIEYRAPIGLDMFLRRLMGDPIDGDRLYIPRFTSSLPIDVDGVAIYLSNSEGLYNDNTYLLDTHPGSPFENGSIKLWGNPGKFADAMLTVGETLAIAELPFEITVDGLRSDGGIDVSISVP